MKKNKSKWFKTVLGIFIFLITVGTFVTGVVFSPPIVKNIKNLEEFSEKKAGIATYSAIGAVVFGPAILIGIHRIATRKKRKLKKLELEKSRQEIIELRKKLKKERT